MSIVLERSAAGGAVEGQVTLHVDRGTRVVRKCRTVADDDVARDIVIGAAPWHGRMLVVNRHCAAESTGHGSPLPHMVHGGPGRAGGGEELGGIRGVMHYMQRLAIQGSPTTLTNITNEYQYGGDYIKKDIHPGVRRELKRLADAEKAERAKPENQGRAVEYDKSMRTLSIDGVVVDKFQPSFFQ